MYCSKLLLLQKIKSLYILYFPSFSCLKLRIFFSIFLGSLTASEEILKLFDVLPLIRTRLTLLEKLFMHYFVVHILYLCLIFCLLDSFEGQEITNKAFCYLAPHCYYQT